MEDLTREIETRLDRPVQGLTRLGGGDVALAFRVAFADGGLAFVKTHPEAPAGFFETEAAGLAWLREADAIPIPEVLVVSDAPSLLVLEWIEPGDSRASTEAELGQALAALHRAGSPCFGREDRRTTGSRRLPNEPAATWETFFRESRLQPLIRLATDERALPSATLSALEEVSTRLAELGGPPEPAARLHGDLWAGNRLVDGRGFSWLIDPAAHGGHREFDLAMMRLFGGYGDDCFSAYHEAFRLAEGWEERVPLHQLAPLVVHAIKFGGGYVRATQQAVGVLVSSSHG